MRPKLLLNLGAVAAMVLVLGACGGSATEDQSDESLSVTSNLSVSDDRRPTTDGQRLTTDNRTIWHNLLNSKSYSGWISVMFKEGSGVRLRPAGDSSFVILSGAKDLEQLDVGDSSVASLPQNDTDGPFAVIARSEATKQSSASPADIVGGINSIIKNFSVEEVKRGTDIPEERIELAIANAAKAGVKLHDWNLYYLLKVTEPSVAEAVLTELGANPSIEYLSPQMVNQIEGGSKPSMTKDVDAGGAGGGGEAPDLVDEQLYLRSDEETGGLNIVAGWERGANGRNVVVVDMEVNWNRSHVDLPETSLAVTLEPSPEQGNRNDPAYIQHGTAVVGVIAGVDNSRGVKGISSESAVKLLQVNGSIEAFNLLQGELVNYWAGEGYLEPDRIRPGDIVVLETGQEGPVPPPVGTSCFLGDVPPQGAEEGTGCVPPEADRLFFNIIKNIIDSGFVIIEGAANGSVDLSNPAETRRGPGDPDLSWESTGAIIAGASLGGPGPNAYQKAPWSNCGSRVDVYAWGGNVVSTGYGDLVGGDNPNRWYTGRFDGTSSATAIIAGVAAQLQSYVKMLYDYHAAYLRPADIRDILVSSGVDAVGDDDCSIGVKPDVGRALEIIDERLADGTLEVQIPEVPEPLSTSVVAGIRYDMDRDGRAELISFSYDHKWYIDLSSRVQEGVEACVQSADNYCAWDLVFDVAAELALPNSMLFPVVHDYNSDGRADLALYDSINGIWYIKYTTSSIVIASPLQNAGGQAPEAGEAIPLTWDRIVDFSNEPEWVDDPDDGHYRGRYSRPVPGDYNGDSWLDLGLQTPDGRWLIDYGGMENVILRPQDEGSPVIEYTDRFGAIDRTVQVLSDEQLAQAPGWAWLPVVADTYDNSNGEYHGNIITKTPDGIAGANEQAALTFPDFEHWEGVYCDECDNEAFIFSAVFYLNPGREYSSRYKSYKGINGSFAYARGGNWIVSPLGNIFGGIDCRPVPADYDGDGLDDLAVLCPASWKIAYSTDADNLREIELNEAKDSLPAYVYPGGIKYQDTILLYNYYKHQLGCPAEQDCAINRAPPPIGPYFAQCIKYWGTRPDYCWGK